MFISLMFQMQNCSQHFHFGFLPQKRVRSKHEVSLEEKMIYPHYIVIICMCKHKPTNPEVLYDSYSELQRDAWPLKLWRNFSKHFEVAGYSIDSLCSTLFTVLKNKNTKIRKRSAFEIYESKNIKDILIYAFSFSLGKIHRNKNGFHT